MESKKKLLTGEIIGKTLKITKATNASLQGIEGEVMDETKNTITIIKDGAEKKLIKNQITFKIKDGLEEVEIEGVMLSSRPEERTKKWLRKKIK